MKRTHLVFLIIVFLSFYSIKAQDYNNASINTNLAPAEEKIFIAVLEFEGKNVTAVDASILTDKLRGELIRTGRFTVLERGAMNDILKEQGFQRTGCTDESCIVEIGQLIGVKKMIAGSIGKIGNMFFISGRMIDIESGQIDKVVDEEIEGDITIVLKKGIPSVSANLAGSNIPSSGKTVKITQHSTAGLTAAPGKGGVSPFIASFCLGPSS
jgi:TolB-like protein